MKILIIIPAYNEEKSIEKVVENLNSNFPQYDYIIVNDGSTDNTEEICRKNNYNYVSLPVNLGIGGGVQTGYLYATKNNYDIAVQMDGDGQHDPAYVEKLIEPLINGEADMTIGSRFIEKDGFQTSFMRRMGILFLRGVIKMCCGVSITDATSGFRATTKKLNKYFSEYYAQDYPEPEAIVESVLAGYRVKEVSVVMKEREEGESSINLIRSIYYMIKVTLALIVHRLRKS